MSDLPRGKVSLVTGAAHGIGRAVALQCGREGSAVLVSDHDAAGAHATAAGLRALGAQVLVVTGNVARAGDIQHLVERCCAHFGRLDIACNHTGPHGVQGMRYQIEAMLRTGGGAVVNVTHTRADTSGAADPRREAQRRETRQLMQQAARPQGAAPIRINTVAPGLIAGSHLPTLFSSTATEHDERVAELVVWLASDRASYVSGAFYPVEAADTAPA